MLSNVSPASRSSSLANHYLCPPENGLPVTNVRVGNNVAVHSPAELNLSHKLILGPVSCSRQEIEGFDGTIRG
jgi:hypothetical protein